MKKCPYCAEDIQPSAIKCKHCGEWLNKGKEISKKTKICPFCAEEIDDSSIKCPACEEQLKASQKEVEKKIVSTKGDKIFVDNRIVDKIRCPSCGYHGTPGIYNPQNSLFKALLFCCGILPGVIYGVYMGRQEIYVCKNCKHDYIIPLDIKKRGMF